MSDIPRGATGFEVVVQSLEAATHIAGTPQMVVPKSNIRWYCPKATTAKLLSVFTQLAEWKATDTHAQQAKERPAAQGRLAPPQRTPETDHG